MSEEKKSSSTPYHPKPHRQRYIGEHATQSTRPRRKEEKIRRRVLESADFAPSAPQGRKKKVIQEEGGEGEVGGRERGGKGLLWSIFLTYPRDSE